VVRRVLRSRGRGISDEESEGGAMGGEMELGFNAYGERGGFPSVLLVHLYGFW